MPIETMQEQRKSVKNDVMLDIFAYYCLTQLHSLDLYHEALEQAETALDQHYVALYG
jgi:hypothetical protein